MIDLGWCLSAGFDFKKYPDAPWSRWAATPLNSIEMAKEVSKIVQQVAVPSSKKGDTILQGFYKRYVVPPGQQWIEDLLHTYEGGAVTFKDKINTAIQTGQAGIISYIGHGGNGSLIGFPTQDHVNETGFLYELR